MHQTQCMAYDYTFDEDDLTLVIFCQNNRADHIWSYFIGWGHPSDFRRSTPKNNQFKTKIFEVIRNHIPNHNLVEKIWKVLEIENPPKFWPWWGLRSIFKSVPSDFGASIVSCPLSHMRLHALHNKMTTSWLSWWWCPLFHVKYKTGQSCSRKKMNGRIQTSRYQIESSYNIV